MTDPVMKKATQKVKNELNGKNDDTVDETIPLQRTWLKADSSDQNGTKADEHDIVANGSLKIDHFNIVSYNILADCLTPEHFFPYCSRKHWKDVQRFPQLMRELDHHVPNIICMQEVKKTTVE